MKNLFFLLLLFASNSYGQFYELDDSFVGDGTQYFQENFIPLHGKFYQNSYYVLGYSDLVNDIYKIHKLNYDGTYDVTFGVNGIATLDMVPYFSSIDGMEIFSGSIYLYGKREDNGSSDGRAFILKLDNAGNVDSTFGLNGFAIADFAPSEDVDYFLRSLTFLSDGSMYCIGTRDMPCCDDPPRLIYFKIKSDGIVDYTFDPNGYKLFPGNYESYGVKIVSYLNGYLLLGTSIPTGFDYPPHNLLLVLVDENGDMINTFGTNGYKMIYFQNFFDLSEADLHGDRIYFTYRNSANIFNTRIGVYDIATTWSLLSLSYNELPTIVVNDEGLWYSGAKIHCSVTPCDNTFNLTRRTLYGSEDPTFLNSVFTYNSFTEPNSNYPRARTRVIIPDPSGKILLAGTASNLFQPNGFALLRLKENNLGLQENTSSTMIYPNPFRDYIYINIDEEIQKIELFDLTGRLVFKRSATEISNHIKISLSEINTKGVYIAKVTTSNNSFTKYVIKE